MNKILQQKRDFVLSPQSIDDISQLFNDSLETVGTDHKDILRLRLSLEELLIIWMKRLSPDSPCTFQSGKRFGKSFIKISVPGPQIDPYEEKTPGDFLHTHLMDQAGLNFQYQYLKGSNCLIINPSGKLRISQAQKLFIALAGGILCGLLGLQLPTEIQKLILSVCQPLTDTFINFMKAISSLLIFFSICCGITGIGDSASAGKIGKKVVGHIFLSIIIISAALFAGSLLVFPTSAGSASGAGNNFGELYSMILNIVPGDPISPFQDGNSLQIIFLGAITGLTLLILGDKVNSAKTVVEQLNELPMYVINILSGLIPFYIFFSIVILLLSGLFNQVGSLVKGCIFIILSNIVLMIVFALIIILKYHLKPSDYIKKLLPTFLIGLTTASSTAAFSTNLETCKKQFGINDNFADFIVPLGQILFKATAIIVFLGISLSLAETQGIALSAGSILTTVITCALLSIAAPPISGASMSYYLIIFGQLGIASSNVAIALTLESVVDYIATSTNLVCLQSNIIWMADKTGMLDRSVLTAPVDQIMHSSKE